MLAVKTTQIKMCADNKESWDFYELLRKTFEFGGTQIRMYTENNLLIVEWDSVIDTKEGITNV